MESLFSISLIEFCVLLSAAACIFALCKRHNRAQMEPKTPMDVFSSKGFGVLQERTFIDMNGDTVKQTVDGKRVVVEKNIKHVSF